MKSLISILEGTGSYILRVRFDSDGKMYSKLHSELMKNKKIGTNINIDKKGLACFSHDLNQIKELISYLRYFQKYSGGFILNATLESSRKYTSNFKDVEFVKKDIRI